MSVFQKFVEWGTDAKYVPGGKKCDICGNKLGVFETGFWSINAKQLADGVLCKDCYEKLELLTRFRTACIPAKLRKEVPFCMLTATRLPQMEVQQAKQALEDAESLGREYLVAAGTEYKSLFRSKEAVMIHPTALDVGIRRAEILNGKQVLFGFVQLGRFQKDDRVVILDGKRRIEAAVLEAYAFDCEENTLEAELKANMGKQQLQQWKLGWLVLDTREEVSASASVIG